jgi:hypothetical protein
MAIEEKVIQPESVTNAEQSVTETPSQPTQPQAPNLDSVKAEYEAQLNALKKQVADEQEKFKGAKNKLDEVYKKKEEQRKQEVESTRTKALAAISNLGAINAEQTLSLLQNKLQKNAEGKVVVLNGGVEQDLNTYLSTLKNPGSGWEHHFKPSSAAGMGAKPSPIANASGGQVNPWKTGNLTQQMLLLEQDPQLAAVLKQEAQK